MGFGYSQKIDFAKIQHSWFFSKFAECPDTGFACYPELRIWLPACRWVKSGFVSPCAGWFFSENLSDFRNPEKKKCAVWKSTSIWFPIIYTVFYFVKRGIEKKYMQNQVKIAAWKYKKDRSFRTLTKIAVLLKICPKKIFLTRQKNKEPKPKNLDSFKFSKMV